MKKPVFTGAAVAIITPFKSTGEVDYEEFGKIIDHQIAHGTDAIVVCGTTGEASALHDKEHREALAWCCEYVNHRVPVSYTHLCRNQHHQCALRQMEVGHKMIDCLEFIARIDENIRPAGLCAHGDVYKRQ